MRNLLLNLKYDGTAYHGWQVQQNAPTVQQTLQDAIEAVLGHRPDVKGCSRTDAGVHAGMYCVNFHTYSAIPCESLIKALNVNLPRDIAVTACREAPINFHARYSAKSKEYVYKILNAPVRDPFWERYALFYPHVIDADKLNEAALAFLGRHDFKGFCSSGGVMRCTVRTVIKFEVQEFDDRIITMTVEADGFLYNMVRIMTGTLLYVAQGKILPKELPGIILAGERGLAGPTAPPHGLYLNRVIY